MTTEYSWANVVMTTECSCTKVVMTTEYSWWASQLFFCMCAIEYQLTFVYSVLPGEPKSHPNIWKNVLLLCCGKSVFVLCYFSVWFCLFIPCLWKLAFINIKHKSHMTLSYSETYIQLFVLRNYGKFYCLQSESVNHSQRLYHTYHCFYV